MQTKTNVVESNNTRSYYTQNVNSAPEIVKMLQSSLKL